MGSPAFFIYGFPALGPPKKKGRKEAPLRYPGFMGTAFFCPKGRKLFLQIRTLH